MSKSYLVIGVVVAFAAGLFWFNSKGKNGESVGKLDSTGKQSLSGSGNYTVNSSESTMNWVGKKTLILNYADNGQISIKDGKFTVSEGKITGGEFNIDMNSITAVKTGKNTGETFLTKHLKSADFFDVEKFPTSNFVITSVDKSEGGANAYLVKGNLTIKGVTQPIEFTADIYAEGSNLVAVGKATLDRTKWDIRYGSGKFFDSLGDNVIDDMFTVELNLKAAPVGV